MPVKSTTPRTAKQTGAAKTANKAVPYSLEIVPGEPLNERVMFRCSESQKRVLDHAVKLCDVSVGDICRLGAVAQARRMHDEWQLYQRWCSLQVGDRVKKRDGAPFLGVVTSIFITVHTKKPRVVVESTVANMEGHLHIYRPDQLERY